MSGLYFLKSFCVDCAATGEFAFEREEIESGGRRWEVYRCLKCGHEIRYAVG